VNLRERGLPPDARTTLESVHEEIESMGAMVEDLLTLARADEGQLVLTPEPIDLHASAARVRETLAIVAATSSVEVFVEGNGTPVLVDRRRIEQVLRNLMANGIAYVGRGGHVVVSTWTARGGSARCSARDDGPGIPSAARDHVFDRFFPPTPRARVAAPASVSQSAARSSSRTEVRSRSRPRRARGARSPSRSPSFDEGADASDRAEPGSSGGEPGSAR